MLALLRIVHEDGDTSDENGFTKIFRSLGSSVNCDLNDDAEVEIGIQAAGDILFPCQKLACKGIIISPLLYMRGNGDHR